MSEIKTISGATLVEKKFPKREWPINKILPQGVILFAGRAKAGKSSLALYASLCIAKGIPFLNKFETCQGEVLYISFQENQELMQDNLRKLNQEIPEGLRIACRLPRLNKGALSQIKSYLQDNPKTKVIVLDMLIDVRPLREQRTDSYQEDYLFLGKIGKFAQKNKISVIVIHHTRKKWAYEILDSISGTTGLAGAADTIWILERLSGSRKGTLSITGRGVREKKVNLFFSAGRWKYKGNTESIKMGPGQKVIYRMLKESTKPLLPGEIAKIVKKTPSNVTHLLLKLYKKGVVKKTERSQYYIPEVHVLKIA